MDGKEDNCSKDYTEPNSDKQSGFNIHQDYISKAFRIKLKSSLEISDM